MRYRHAAVRVAMLALVVGLPVACAFASVSVALAAPLSDTATRTVEQIRARWSLAEPIYTGSPFLVKPHVHAPYSAGRLQPLYVQDGLNMVNFARYLVGLPDDVIIDSTYADLAQHAAVVVDATPGWITHEPTRPADMPQAFFDLGYEGASSSNLHWGGPLYDNVKSWLSDEDPTNIEVVGHRRWVLNPPMAMTGFGDTGPGGCSAMYAFDFSRSDPVSYAYYGWPAAGPFPLEFFSDGRWGWPEYGTPWSIHLNPDDYDLDPIGIVVTLTRVSNAAHWTFDYADRPRPGKVWDSEYLNVDSLRYGDPVCIIFRPKSSVRYNSGDAFDVRVSGTVFEKGTTTRTEIRYRTRFFRVEPLPRITSLSPSSGKRGAVITITGKSFDFKRGENYVRFGESACTKYVSWSDTRIRVKVPASAASGSVRVFVRAKAGEGNGRSFKVKQ